MEQNSLLLLLNILSDFVSSHHDRALNNMVKTNLVDSISVRMSRQSFNFVIVLMQIIVFPCNHSENWENDVTQ